MEIALGIVTILFAVLWFVYLDERSQRQWIEREAVTRGFAHWGYKEGELTLMWNKEAIHG